MRTKEYEVERHALFFTDKDARRIYKENVKYTLTRRSTLTGRAYKDDPTIMAWGLLNEPRCETWKVLFSGLHVLGVATPALDWSWGCCT